MLADLGVLSEGEAPVLRQDQITERGRNRMRDSLDGGRPIGPNTLFSARYAREAFGVTRTLGCEVSG